MSKKKKGKRYGYGVIDEVIGILIDKGILGSEDAESVGKEARELLGRFAKYMEKIRDIKRFIPNLSSGAAAVAVVMVNRGLIGPTEDRALVNIVERRPHTVTYIRYLNRMKNLSVPAERNK